MIHIKLLIFLESVQLNEGNRAINFISQECQEEDMTKRQKKRKTFTIYASAFFGIMLFLFGLLLVVQILRTQSDIINSLVLYVPSIAIMIAGALLTIYAFSEHP